MPTAIRRTIGTDAETFESQALNMTRVAVQANQRITAAFELEDVIDLQSSLANREGEIRKVLMKSVEEALNSYLYSLVSPSTSAPDHTVASVTDFNLAQLSNVRTLASQADWPEDQRWLLVDPQYYSDLLDDTTLASSDFGGDDAPLVGGRLVRQRMGFNIVEDRSAGLLTLSASSQDAGIAFHPSAMALVVQKEPTFKISDLHSNKQHGYLISVDLICGAVQYDDERIISIINS